MMATWWSVCTSKTCFAVVDSTMEAPPFSCGCCYGCTSVVDASMDAPPFNALWWGRVHLEKLVALVSQLHRPLLVCPQLVDYLGDQDGGFKASSSILGAWIFDLGTALPVLSCSVKTVSLLIHRPAGFVSCHASFAHRMAARNQRHSINQNGSTDATRPGRVLDCIRVG